jgi:hypothetical protein
MVLKRLKRKENNMEPDRALSQMLRLKKYKEHKMNARLNKQLVYLRKHGTGC